MSQRNGFHLVDNSPWPLLLSFSALGLTSGTVMYMHGYEGGLGMLTVSLGWMVVTMSLWLRDIVREGTYEGQHTARVQLGMRLGMLMFIASEAMLFVALFWAYFWGSVAPVVEIGSVWPPKGIEVLSAWEIPLLNTLILVSSGASVTWAHHAILCGNRKEALVGLGITLVLGALFTCIQGGEYLSAPFNIGDSVYGSGFYMCTGFHGFHVLLGTIMLAVSWVRLYRYELTREHHFGFESSAWYWHFVDVVWLLLFVSIYWWGS